jgi:DNA-binding XRE family transcriptional regulator
MTRLSLALAAYQQKHDIENRQMAKDIDISASTLSRIKAGTMPDALGMAKIMLWFALPETKHER